MPSTQQGAKTHHCLRRAEGNCRLKKLYDKATGKTSAKFCVAHNKWCVEHDVYFAIGRQECSDCLKGAELAAQEESKAKLKEAETKAADAREQAWNDWMNNTQDGKKKRKKEDSKWKKEDSKWKKEEEGDQNGSGEEQRQAQQ